MREIAECLFVFFLPCRLEKTHIQLDPSFVVRPPLRALCEIGPPPLPTKGEEHLRWLIRQTEREREGRVCVCGQKKTMHKTQKAKRHSSSSSLLFSCFLLVNLNGDEGNASKQKKSIKTVNIEVKRSIVGSASVNSKKFFWTLCVTRPFPLPWL